MAQPANYTVASFNVRPGRSEHDGRCVVERCAERLVYVFDLGPWQMRLCARHVYLLKQALPTLQTVEHDKQNLPPLPEN